MAGIRKAYSRSFKIIFGAVSLLGFLLIGVIARSMTEMGAPMAALIGPWTIVPIGISLWLLLRRRKGPSLSEDPRFSAFGDESRTATDTIYPGLGATVEILANGISITREGVVSALAHGLKGEKRIAFASITATQFRQATPRTNGYIQFSILGGVENGRGIMDAAKDENTVMFTCSQEAAFRRLREVVERQMAQIREPTAPTAPFSIADEIAKLASLNAQGILTNDEFAARKAVILK